MRVFPSYFQSPIRCLCTFTDRYLHPKACRRCVPLPPKVLYHISVIDLHTYCPRGEIVSHCPDATINLPIEQAMMAEGLYTLIYLSPKGFLPQVRGNANFFAVNNGTMVFKMETAAKYADQIFNKV